MIESRPLLQSLKDLFFLHNWEPQLPMTVKTDDVTSGSRDLQLDPHERLGVVQHLRDEWVDSYS